MSSSELNPLREQGDSSTEWKVFEDLLDESGRPRLNYARNYFAKLLQEDLPVLSNAFKYWRDFDEALLLYGKNRVNEKEMWLGVKCSKRGNDVFTDRLDRKMGFLKAFEGITMFSLEDFNLDMINKGVSDVSMPSNLLWFTLTFNPSSCSLDEAWERIGSMWNLWITNMRNKYGKIQALKFLEAFPNPESSAAGYPHIHAVLLFEDHNFQAFPHWELDKRTEKWGWVYRVREKDEIKSQGKWAAFSDIKALHSGKALGGYLRKHCKNTHGGDDPAALTTQSLLWLKKKQTFSMSSEFRQKFSDLITGMHDSKTEAQMTLDGEILDDWIWTAHGVRSCFDVGMEKGVWFMSLEEEKFHRLVNLGGS